MPKEATEKLASKLVATIHVDGSKVVAEILAKAFNRWLDEYENHPENFEQQWATIRRHLKEKAEGVEPTYGEKCVGMLNFYIDELAAEEKEEALEG